MGCFWACVLMLLATLPGGLIAREPDAKGTEFILGFMDMKVLLGAKYHDVELIITTESNTPVYVTVTLPLFYLSWSKTVVLDRFSPKRVTIPYQIRGSQTEKANKGVYVLASQDVTVVAANKESNSTGTFLVLPVDVLGSDYYTVMLAGQPELLVVGTQDNTHVSLTWPFTNETTVVYNGVTYRQGDTLHLDLDRYQTFHAYNNRTDGDFTGAHIVTSKPVAVFSGNKYVTAKGLTHDHVSEMMKPVASWGKEFHSTNIGDRTVGDIYKFVASQDNTTVTVVGGTQFKIDYAGGFEEALKPSFIFTTMKSDKPIMLAVISLSNNKRDKTGGDPSMILDIPPELYSANFTWFTVMQANGRNFNNTITVIIDGSMVENLTLDGNVPKWDGEMVIAGSTKIHLWKYITAGVHYLYHPNHTVRYFACASGRVPNNSYAFLLGMRMRNFSSNCSVSLPTPGDKVDNDCDGKVDEEVKNWKDDDNDGQIDEDTRRIKPPVDIHTHHCCEIYKDPHVRSFSNQVYSLPIPCAYRAAGLLLINLPKRPGVTYNRILVEVKAGNSQTDINGRYFVSDVSIRVTFLRNTLPQRSTTVITSEKLFDTGKIWNVSSGSLPSRVKLSYNKTGNAAQLRITQSSLRIQFRPVNRNQGLRQKLPPGVFIEVRKKEVIYNENVKFLYTMCSTANDTSIDDYIKEYNVTEHTIGLYAVMQQFQNNTEDGYQDDLCPTVMSKYHKCRNQTYAFDTCISLLRHAPTVNCLNSHPGKTSAMNVVNLCLDYRCQGHTFACWQLLILNKTCDKLASLLDVHKCT